MRRRLKSFMRPGRLKQHMIKLTLVTMAGKNEIFIYHRRAPDFAGERLLPLNRLKGPHPGLYAEAVKKYSGREWLLDLYGCCFQ